MEDDLDANYELVNDIDASQTAQFNDGAGFDPVGGPGFDENTPPPFTGRFDGNNQTITDLTITRPDERYVGLFGATDGDGATLADVTLANVTATGNRDVGGVVGRNFANITDATASGNVTGERFVGGVAGSNDGIIIDATTSGNVTGVSGDSGDSLSVGGVVGVNRGNVTATTAESVTVTSDRSVGGLVGSNSGIITDATASGSVNGTERVGGLVGSNFVSITGASASTSVTGNRDVGGLVGENSATITDAFAVGSITGTDDVGGLVGQNQSDATVEQSYFDIQATGQTISAGGIGLTTTEMQGTGAAQNMDLAFGETWQTVSGDYPELIAPQKTTNPSTTPFSAPVPGADGQGPPTDTDDDGKFEDITGDGEATFDDAIALAFADTSGLNSQQRAAVDFDGDGDVDFADAIALAFE
jgi:hypothetical protein